MILVPQPDNVRLKDFVRANVEFTELASYIEGYYVQRARDKNQRICLTFSRFFFFFLVFEKLKSLEGMIIHATQRIGTLS